MNLKKLKRLAKNSLFTEVEVEVETLLSLIAMAEVAQDFYECIDWDRCHKYFDNHEVANEFVKAVVALEKQ